MLKLPDTQLGIGSYIRPKYPVLDTPPNKALLLRSPIKYKAGIEPLDNDYLENLIQTNIVIHEGSKHNQFTSQYHAADIRAFYNSLSEEHKARFIELVKAFGIAITEDKNKEQNLKMIKGMLVQGGEIRVVAATGHIMLIHALTMLLGIKLKEFYGVSAGAFQAAGQAVNAPNSSVFANTADTDFASFVRVREKLKNWINAFLVEGYTFNTGKEIDVIRGEHIKEFGANLQVLVGEVPKIGNIPIPQIKTYYLPQELETRFDINPHDFEIATAIAASANLPCLFFSLTDFTFGECFIEDSSGKKHYLVDGGIRRKNMLPYHPLENGIKAYLEGKEDVPPFYFIIGNSAVNSKLIPPEALNEIKEHGTWLERFLLKSKDLIDDIIDVSPSSKIRELGAEKAYTEAVCIVDDPFNPGKVAMLNSGNMSVPAHQREVLMCANMGFAVDEMHKNLVDTVYVSSSGKSGKSPLALYKDQIDETHKLNLDIDMHRAVFDSQHTPV